MKCPKCKYQNKDGFTVCNLCGEPLPKIAPAAGAGGAAAPAGVPDAARTRILGSTWSSPRFGVTVRRPGAPNWALTAEPADLRRKNAAVEIVHLPDRYTVSVIPYDWSKVPAGAAMTDVARAVLERDEGKKGRMVMNRGMIAVDGRPALRVLESYLDAASGKPTQEVSVFIERAAGFLRFAAAMDGLEFDAHLPHFQEIVESAKLDAAADMPPTWFHSGLNLALARPAGPDSADWGWVQDPQALEQRGGGWIVELVNSAAGARVAVRAHDPGGFAPVPGNYNEAMAALVGAMHEAAPDLRFNAPPARADVSGISALLLDVTYGDPQRGPLRTRRLLAPHPAVLVEVVAEAAPDRFDALAPVFDAIFATFRLPAGGSGIRPPTPWNLAAWGITLGVPEDLRWVPCTTPGFLRGEGCVLEFRDLATPAAKIDLRTHKRLPGLDMGMTLGGWALKFERGGKDEADFAFESKDRIEIDGQPALTLVRSWKTADTGQPRRDRLVCFERKGAMCVLRAVSTPDDFPRVEEELRRIGAGTKLAASHHAASVLDEGPPAGTIRIVKTSVGGSRPPVVQGGPPTPTPPPAGAPPPPPAAPSVPARLADGAAPKPPKTTRTKRSRLTETGEIVRLSLETPIDQLEKTLRENPADTRASILLALRFMATQRHEAAADVLRQAFKRLENGGEG